jgi:glutamate formiminotransferase
MIKLSPEGAGAAWAYSPVNISGGGSRGFLDAVREAVGEALLDLHFDPYHDRTVATVFSEDLLGALRVLSRVVACLSDFRVHRGLHPCLGALDVVPFVPLPPFYHNESAPVMRDEFARWLSQELRIPVFLYGPERELPEVRRAAFSGIRPDLGPLRPHERLGASCVGLRGPLVAYNLFVDATPGEARRLLPALRAMGVRALVFEMGDQTQISFNLVDPLRVGPREICQAVSAHLRIRRPEVVGLIPAEVVKGYSEDELEATGIGEEHILEWRMKRAGVSWPSAPPAAPS